MAEKVMKFGFTIATFLVGIASVASAIQVSGEAGEATRFLSGWDLLNGIIGVVVYSALGLIGFKVFDKATPFSLNKEIAEDNNVAAGVVVAGIMIGLGIIVAAAIL